MNTKQLTRSITNKRIAGVCGGLGEYCNIDPVLFRIAFCFAIFMGGTGFFIYLIMILAVPEQNPYTQQAQQNDEIIVEEFSAEKKKNITDVTMLVFGALLIFLGVFFFLVRMMPFRFHEFFFPTLLMVGGILLLIFSKKK